MTISPPTSERAPWDLLLSAYLRRSGYIAPQDLGHLRLLVRTANGPLDRQWVREDPCRDWGKVEFFAGSADKPLEPPLPTATCCRRLLRSRAA